MDPQRAAVWNAPPRTRQIHTMPWESCPGGITSEAAAHACVAVSLIHTRTHTHTHTHTHMNIHVAHTKPSAQAHRCKQQHKDGCHTGMVIGKQEHTRAKCSEQRGEENRPAWSRTPDRDHQNSPASRLLLFLIHSTVQCHFQTHCMCCVAAWRHQAPHATHSFLPLLPFTRTGHPCGFALTTASASS